jgi:hypothetical protein
MTSSPQGREEHEDAFVLRHPFGETIATGLEARCPAGDLQSLCVAGHMSAWW